MKKLLFVLGALSLTTVASTTVVACNKDNDTTFSKVKDEIKLDTVKFITGTTYENLLTDPGLLNAIQKGFDKMAESNNDFKDLKVNKDYKVETDQKDLNKTVKKGDKVNIIVTGISEKFKDKGNTFTFTIEVTDPDFSITTDAKNNEVTIDGKITFTISKDDSKKLKDEGYTSFSVIGKLKTDDVQSLFNDENNLSTTVDANTWSSTGILTAHIEAFKDNDINTKKVSNSVTINIIKSSNEER